MEPGTLEKVASAVKVVLPGLVDCDRLDETGQIRAMKSNAELLV
jgi:hypothetical protein